jgi:hypothetical protein
MKKKKSTKQPSFTPKQIRVNAANLLKMVCDKLVAPGLYAKFYASSRDLILNNRYPAVKLYGSDDKVAEELFQQNLNATEITTLIGQKISLANYLREGLMLIQFVEMMAIEQRPIHSDLITAFEPYFRETEIYESVLNDVVRILQRLAIIQSDWSVTVLEYDLQGLCAVKGVTASNQVRVKNVRSEQISLQLDGYKREVLRIGWPEAFGGLGWISIQPSKIGIVDRKQEDTPVFIQRHALNRLDERLRLYPGIVHEAIAATFQTETCQWLHRNEKTLVALKILNKKVGYLVVSYDQDKIIIRSFLFLTNNGTPEGNKLSELTKLAPLDKKYLGMDTLPGFVSFDFPSNAELSELFRKAGCEDLLKLDDLINFSEAVGRSKHPMELMKYLAQYENTDDI